MTQVRPQSKRQYLKDYQPPTYTLESVNLNFNINDLHTIVTVRFKVTRNVEAPQGPLMLYGDELKLHSLSVNNKLLTAQDYQQDEQGISIDHIEEGAEITVVTELEPRHNRKLMGLYQSGEFLCTQCESHGFRRITYYPDRPDVMARFTTTIEASQERYPILLSNGNCVDRKSLEGGRHQVTFEDPFKKPCYLFALVAGDFGELRDHYTTQNGRTIDLTLYADHKNIDQCQHAMQALKKAMQWDEQTYDLEYDLDQYMIVAVNDFNQGAMENKGLNIFNDHYIFASPVTATDQDYESIDAVVGHEYFHNYSGNRVTLRDWFQLSLKEGLTVFREQSFCESIHSKPLKRIQDAKLLRTRQFVEDNGPLSHPVRPDSYIEMNNFYTMTVYEKGAEVIRVLRTLLGERPFTAGLKEYFKRYDGQAVTVEDFLQVFADTTGRDLTQFKRWYTQSGTPEVTITTKYDQAKEQFILTASQQTAATQNQAQKQPLVIPITVALFDPQGNTMRLDNGQQEQVLELNQAKQRFVFEGITSQPVLSSFRHFSAPVKQHRSLSDDELLFLAIHDNDAFSAWDAGQTIFMRTMRDLITQIQNAQSLNLHPALPALFDSWLSHDKHDGSLMSYLMSPPTLMALFESMQPIDPKAIYTAYDFMRIQIAEQFQQPFLAIFEANHQQGPYDFNQQQVAMRRLKATALSYLLCLDFNVAKPLCTQLMQQSHMTDKHLGLVGFCQHQDSQSDAAIAEFYEQFKHQPLVMDKWFATQASSKGYGDLVHIQQLAQHPQFTLNNPNKVYSLFGAFAKQNLRYFHQQPGAYQYVIDIIKQLNDQNPMVAGKLLNSFSQIKQLAEPYQSQMRAALQDCQAHPELSKDVAELLEQLLYTQTTSICR